MVSPVRTFSMKQKKSGFTLIELVVAMAIMAILAMIAIPSLQDKWVREQIVEAMRIAEVAKVPVTTSWSLKQTVPADNNAAGLPIADKIVSTWVSSVAIEDGAIHVIFGNRANGSIIGKTLTLRPAVVVDAPVVPVAWVCGRAAPVEKMTAMGKDRTTVPSKYLPLNCR
jgi:type IV pilus assembly protein PilA